VFENDQHFNKVMFIACRIFQLASFEWLLVIVKLAILSFTICGHISPKPFAAMVEGNFKVSSPDQQM